MIEDYLDWDISKPYLLLALLNACGLIGAVYRFMYGSLEPPTVLISVTWVFYNLVVLGGSVAVAKEMKQQRRKPRVEFSMKAAYRLTSGHMSSCHLTDYSDGGAGICILPSQQLHDGEKLELILSLEAITNFPFQPPLASIGTGHRIITRRIFCSATY